MPEAAIFYCGRALEVTSARAVSALNLEPGSQVFANLDTLERLSCISRPALYLGHALRRLSNDARHILRPLSRHDADFAALCLGPWLQWYMEDYFRGPQGQTGGRDLRHRRLAARERHGRRCAGAVAPARRRRARMCRTTCWRCCDDRIAHLPALSSMIAETLISCGRADAGRKPS